MEINTGVKIKMIYALNINPIVKRSYVKHGTSKISFSQQINKDLFVKEKDEISENPQIVEGKKDLIKQSKYLSDKNLTAGSGGNISMRVGDKFLISKAGSLFSDLTEKDISVLDSNGKLLDGEKPSSETPMHLAVYKNRPEVNSVIHFHPVYATVYAVANKTMLPNILPHTTKHFYDLKVAPYENAGSDELAQKTASQLGQSEALLLGNHGALVVGKTPQIAAKTADSLENYAKISYLLENSCFKYKQLNKDNVDYMVNSAKSNK